MTKYYLKKSQVQRLVETAMDLDRYNQPMQHNTKMSNEDMIKSTSDAVTKLNELSSIFKSKSDITFETKQMFFRLVDEINKMYDKIKTQN